MSFTDLYGAVNAGYYGTAQEVRGQSGARWPIRSPAGGGGGVPGSADRGVGRNGGMGGRDVDGGMEKRGERDGGMEGGRGGVPSHGSLSHLRQSGFIPDQNNNISVRHHSRHLGNIMK